VKILVTGAAGFIGYHVAEALLARGDSVVGLDSLNDYYDVRLKQARLDRLRAQPGFEFHHLDVSDKDAVGRLVADHADFGGIVHLAAQAGVRYSLVDPYAYVQANVMGHLVVLEAARRLPALRHMVYASTSSVYGSNTEMPFRETDRVDHPVSLYAATKRADELMSHAYGHLFGLPQAPGAARTWPISPSLRPLSPVNRSPCTTRAACAGISPISTISSPASSAAWTGHPRIRTCRGC
jgi:UDP-glucuronate 4-epimerase